MNSAQSTAAWLLPFALLVWVVIAVPLLILDDRGLPRYRALRDELHGMEESNDALRQRVLALREEVEALRHDRGAVERIARDELGWVRDGEVVFLLPE